MATARIIGAGRAGGSFAGALAALGWQVETLGRDDDLSTAAHGVDLLLLTVPDGAIASVAAAVGREPTTVVAHASGALGLAPLAGHWRRAVIHPLAALPDEATGELLLREGHPWFGLSAEGDPLVAEIVDDLGGHAVTIAEGDWVRYHAAAVIASNHLVGLLGQVERVAAGIGVPLEAYLDLAAGAFRNVVDLGAAAALTGPVRRGDWATVEAHLAALPQDERAAYQAGVELCRRLLDP